ncbi:HU family DNA-binding protein [Rickettsiales bacterium LUAb2]
MKSSDLIAILHKKYNYLSYDEIKVIVEEVFNYLKAEIKQENRIEIRGFGVFEAKKYKEKLSFNPKTLEYNQLSSRLIPFYKSSIVLKQRINK